MHVDGSTDGTLEALYGLTDASARLKISDGPNQGRAGALVQAIHAASAPFVMIFDDDDDVSIEGVCALLPMLAQVPADVCGYVCHMRDENGDRLGSAFPAGRSNFMRLRLEQGVSGDKKEVVRSPLLKQVAQPPPPGVRRVPTSLLWGRIALNHDVLCLDLDLGVKRYLDGGYTRGIGRIKRANPGPMRDVHALSVTGFLQGRHGSIPAALRGLSAACAYAVLAAARPRPASR